MSDCRSSTKAHFFSGACGGTIAAIVTCPLEVLKTRLQSSSQVFHKATTINGKTQLNLHAGFGSTTTNSLRPVGIIGRLRYMAHTEGFRSLYKGLGPNLVGVAPARAIYFAVYAKSSRFIVTSGVDKDSPVVHMCAGASAGLVTQTMTAPIWFVKTRLQLNNRTINVGKVIWGVYKKDGIRGFYRGLSASYFGTIETIIYFVVYERLKRMLREFHRDYGIHHVEKNSISDFMLAAGFSKSVASICAYPHEVVRTRLRLETVGERKYKSFFQTLFLVYREEGRNGLYGGLGTQLVRQVPNSAVMFMVYELVMFMLCSND